MSVLKEWKCAVHGSFEGSHPICPAYGCVSEKVEREFLTPINIRSAGTRNTDRGLRRTVDSMRLRDLRSSRHEGDVSYAGRAQENKTPIGSELLWGRDVERVMGKPFAAQVQAAQAPLVVPGKNAKVDPYLTHNSGMRSAATTLGITQRTLPPAEITGARGDKGVAA